jgi:hypothetical protein
VRGNRNDLDFDNAGGDFYRAGKQVGKQMMISRLVHDTDCVLVVSHAVDAQSNHDSRGRVASLWMFPLARPALDLI